ncbi:hypothetical protein PLESTB_000028300 [Pleodorina starrii]|uniref:tRNA (guanine(46)-N(7))-methyltransferase n=1 Tax=Pleodorina starrii TaxID=330485 RepID=A0A9W6BA96_9CHLO|nr:hypothetical protein PLESTM_001106300 [Pleodorina starrii]GLC47811.1 hypothetical protein PLESTB_000028300 [Pleodorina starrii]
MAVRKGPGKNYLGVDVHKALLDRANGWAAARSLSGHVHYLQANAVVSAGALLGSYPGPVELVSIQYPDPQQRRQRHIVGRELVEALAAVLQPGARVYLASDFEDTAAFMRNAFERHGSGAFRVDDVHANQPVFPCTPAAAVAAAAVATSGGRKSSPEAIGSTSEAEETRPSSSEAGGAVRPTSSASSLPGGVETTSGSGQPEGASERGASAGVVDEDDLLWFQGSWERAGWLVENPVGAPTEREVYQMATKGPVYRALLVRM